MKVVIIMADTRLIPAAAVTTDRRGRYHHGN